MKINPLSTWIVVIPLEAPERMSGIAIPDEWKARMRGRPLGRIIELGPDLKLPTNSLNLAIGQTILYDLEHMRRVQGLDTKTYILVKAENVIGVVDADEEATAEDLNKARDADRQRKNAEATQRFLAKPPIGPAPAMAR